MLLLFVLMAGKPALDATIAGGQAVEDDPSVNSVGFGGLPNALGTVALDACVMDGKTLDCGAVAAVENVRHVAALARRVMEKTPHILLVGEGARLFALQEGFPLNHMLTPEALKEWDRQRQQQGTCHSWSLHLQKTSLTVAWGGHQQHNQHNQHLASVL